MKDWFFSWEVEGVEWKRYEEILMHAPSLLAFANNSAFQSILKSEDLILSSIVLSKKILKLQKSEYAIILKCAHCLGNRKDALSPTLYHYKNSLGFQGSIVNYEQSLVCRSAGNSSASSTRAPAALLGQVVLSGYWLQPHFLMFWLRLVPFQ